MPAKLPLDFYFDEDVVQVAQNLLGKSVFTSINGELAGGIIIETEAYKGPEDRGSHAYANRRTPRNEMMYAAGGVAYMYICYGIHNMLNVVTGPENTPHAVLIRALEPTVGIEIMRKRRNIYSNDRQLCKGPGALTRALGLSNVHNGVSLQGDVVWIENCGLSFTTDQIIASPRIGLSFGGPYQTIPWRFYVSGNRYVSRPVAKISSKVHPEQERIILRIKHSFKKCLKPLPFTGVLKSDYL